MQNHDILILGAGPAGLSTALHLARDYPPLATRVLILDKEHHPRFKLCAGGLTLDAEAILRRFGCDVELAKDGPEALTCLARSRFDAILMDLQMPGMDGFQTTKAIREPGSAVLDHDVPVVALTAHARASDRDACLAAGMSAFLTKPLRLAELAETLEGLALPGRWRVPRPEPEHSLVPDAGLDLRTFLERMGGDAGLARQVLEVFLEDFPVQLELIRAALARTDAAEVDRLAHRLRGSAANLGLSELQKVIARLEESAKSGDFSLAAVLVETAGSGLAGLRSLAPAVAGLGCEGPERGTPA